MKACVSGVLVSYVPNVKKETVWMLGHFTRYTEALNVFNPCTDWFSFALSCWCVALCSFSFSVWGEWGGCKAACIRRLLFEFGRTLFFFISVGKTVYILRYVKTTKGPKNKLHTASVSHTVHVCSALQSQAVSAFSEPFFEKVILKNAGRLL